MVDAETGRRGYLLTGDRSYLDPYHAALTRDEDDFKGLADVAASDGDARGEIDALGGLADGKLAEPRRTIDLYSAGKVDQVLALVQTGAGKAIMEATGA